MSKRTVKIAVLVLSGGVLLQLGACLPLLVQNFAGFFVSNILSTLISTALNAVTGGAAANP